MGHRQLSNTSQIFEIDQDQSRSCIFAGHSYIHMGRAVAPENGPFHHPIENVPTSGHNSASQRSFENRPIEHSSTNFMLEAPQVHASLFGPSYDNYPRAGGGFYQAPETNAVHSHSLHYNRHGIHEVDGGSLDHAVGNGRGTFKRKSPGISVSCGRGSTNRFYGAGSSFNTFELQLEQPTSDYTNYSSECLPPSRGDSSSIGGEISARNVRSRSRHDLEPKPWRNYSSCSLHPRSTSHLQNHPEPPDVGNLPAYEQNHIQVSHPAHGTFQSSANNSLRHVRNRYYAGRNTANIDGYHHESILSRNPFSRSQYLPGFHAQAARHVRNNYSQRGIPSHNVDLSSSISGSEAAISENGQQFLSETNRSGYSRPLSSGGWRNNHREGRLRIAIERFQSLSNARDAHSRMGSEAFMMLDHSYLYGSRNLFDQYSDMRLDIDNMSYEELLALGERIGNVNTGLSEDVVAKHLIENTHPSSNDNLEEASCAICLEEYKKMDKVGMVKNCGHDFHQDCIKKWLSMKNACPICKAPVLDDTSNGE